jgi:hypothetical protein
LLHLFTEQDAHDAPTDEANAPAPRLARCRGQQGQLGSAYPLGHERQEVAHEFGEEPFELELVRDSGRPERKFETFWEWKNLSMAKRRKSLPRERRYPFST